MANKKEINQKSCIRLRELISELKMTQSQFGELLGLGSRQISCMVNGARRLTEDNARRIAQMFPEVRYEWLMGYDDYKTEGEYKKSKLDEELFEINKEYLKFHELCYQAEEIVGKLGYEFTNTALLPKKAKLAIRNECEVYELIDIIKNPENYILRKLFSEDELNSIYERLESYDKISHPGYHELTEENYERILQKERVEVTEAMKVSQELHSYMPYYLCDKNGNIAAQFSYTETCAFIQQLHDVVEAMIIYYMNKHKKED